MSEVLKFEKLRSLIIELRGQSVLLDSDVAVIYGVEKKRINEAVKNNPAKFPAGYIMELNKDERALLKSKFSTSTKGGKVKLPNAFPEKGLYIGYDLEKQKSHRSYACDNRNIFKNKNTFKKYKRVVNS